MKDLTLTKTNVAPGTGTKPVFIDIELHAKIKELKEETGLPITTIVDTFLRYGVENVQIKDGE